MCPDDAADEDQRHRGHGHHTIVHITVVIAPLRNNLEAEQCAGADEFTEEAYDDEDDGVADAVANTVEERRPGLVHHDRHRRRAVR